MLPPPTAPSSADDGPGTQQIANRPIVCHAVDTLLSAGVEEVAVVAPPAAMSKLRECIEQDEGSDADVTFLTQRGRLDLLGAIQTAEDFVGDSPAIAHRGDGLLQGLHPVAELLNGGRPDLVLVLHRGIDDRDRLEPATQTLLGVSELNGSRSRLALAGLCVFGPGALRHACEAPAGASPVGLVAIAQHFAGQGHPVSVGFVQSWRRYRGDPLDLLELNRIVLDQQALEDEPLDRGDNRIEGRVIIHPSAEVRSSIVLGPSIIGPRARILNSYIGPYTSIGAGAEIEDAEIVRSIILEGARIMHVSRRIEASTIGRDASIFRDFKLPRAMRLHVGQGVEVALN